MKWTTLGDKNAPAVLFFHAMGVTGESSVDLAMAFLARTALPVEHVYFDGG